MKVKVCTTVLWLAMVGLLLILTASRAGEEVPERNQMRPATQKQAKKIVFLWSKSDHGHPNEQGCWLFKHCLENSSNIKGIKCQMYEGWPEHTAVLDDAATIVIYSEGINEEMKKAGEPHPIFNSPQRLEYLDKLMKKGTGMVCIHYTLCGSRQLEAPKLLDWVGAYYDFAGYGSRHFAMHKPQLCQRSAPDHPISHGWKDFTLDQHELYHNLRFKQTTRALPFLVVPYFEGIHGPYLPTPIVTAAFKDKDTNEMKQYVIGWALQREDGGRGFGFGGGHFYSIWMNEDCRKMILNAIIWTAKIQVPADAVLSSVPEQLKIEEKAGL
jgi:hypothetical protein